MPFVHTTACTPTTQATARVKQQPEAVFVSFHDLWSILVELKFVDANQPPPPTGGLSTDRRAVAVLYSDTRKKMGPEGAPPPSQPPPTRQKLTIGGKVSIGALRRCCQPVPPKPLEAPVLSAWDKKMNPERLKEKLALSLGRMAGLFRAWDIDGNATVDQEEFARAVAALGIQADSDVVEIVFKECAMLERYAWSYARLASIWLSIAAPPLPRSYPARHHPTPYTSSAAFT